MKKIFYVQRPNKDRNINIKMEIKFTKKEKIKSLKIPIKFSPKLAYFYGVLVGDGNIGYREKKKEYCIKCFGNPKDEKEFYDMLIKNLIKKLFNLDTTVKFHDKKTTRGSSLYSKTFVRYLTEVGLPLGKKYDKLKIPKVFSGDELIKNFISGVADTDFHLALKRNNYPMIIGISKSERFINEIKEYLLKQGFRVFKKKREYYDRRVSKLEVTYTIYVY